MQHAHYSHRLSITIQYRANDICPIQYKVTTPVKQIAILKRRTNIHRNNNNNIPNIYQQQLSLSTNESIGGIVNETSSSQLGFHNEMLPPSSQVVVPTTKRIKRPRTMDGTRTITTTT
jgi:hypothetical protein